jgi:polyhydroxybutyrate depolymerase
VNRSLRRLVPLALAAAVVAGCSGPSNVPAPAGPSSDVPAVVAGGAETITVGSRPFTLHVPSGYRSGTPAPLLVLLHGYTSSAEEQERYLKFAPEADRRGVLYATPDGTLDSRNNRFWNATDACCNLYGSTVDDGAYLIDVIKAVSAKYTVDTRRVYLFGHSNGAFMSYRMACEHADVIAGIAALNGAMWSDLSKCAPSRPVSVLHIRGTTDSTIDNDGGVIAGHRYPGTAETVADWVSLDGCGATPEVTPDSLDFESAVAGAETGVSRYPGCREGSRVELWAIKGGRHVPAFSAAFAPAVFDFLLAQSLV